MDDSLTRPRLLAVLREAREKGDHIAYNAAVECLSARFWIRTDEYVLRGADGNPMAPQLSASILRRQRRRNGLRAWPPAT